MSGYTEADVQLVIEWFRHWFGPSSARKRMRYREYAESVLAALAAAGRLLPEDTQVEQEWTMRYRLDGGPHQIGEDAGHVLDSRDEAVRHIEAWRKCYPQLTYSDVSYLRRDVITGPWVPVPEEGEQP